jgi:hypothetical protein
MTSLSEFNFSYNNFEDTMPGMKHFHVPIYFDENCLLAARTLTASADLLGLRKQNADFQLTLKRKIAFFGK